MGRVRVRRRGCDEARTWVEEAAELVGRARQAVEGVQAFVTHPLRPPRLVPAPTTQPVVTLPRRVPQHRAHPRELHVYERAVRQVRAGVQAITQRCVHGLDGSF